MSEAENIGTAMLKAQLKFGPVIKSAENKHFGNKYADLADLVAAVVPVLNAHGVRYYAKAVRQDGEDFMATILDHPASGTSEECLIRLVVSKNDMQAMKSATTYAKRIGLESLTGIAPEDDDGQAATVHTVSEMQAAAIEALITSTGADRAKLLAYAKAGSVEEIRAKDFGQIEKMLKAKAK
jgi:hypothetical protein